MRSPILPPLLWCFGLAVLGVVPQRALAVEDDLPALFLSRPATNFHSSFTMADWKFDSRDDTTRQALTAPSVFKVYHLHMNHHASHLNSDVDTGAQFLNFHQTLIRSYNTWRMEQGLEASLAYVACNPMPEGHTELNNGIVRPPGFPMVSPCAPMPLTFRIPPIGTLGQAGATPPMNSFNAVGHALNLTWHSGTHLALGYGSLLEDGRNGDMGSTDKSPLDPAFWMWHAAVADVADVWLRTQPADLVVAVDRSGSMGLPISANSSTTRLMAAQDGLLFLARLLPQVVPGGDGRPHRLGLVTFNDTATTQLNLTPINGNGFLASWSNAVLSLTASGGTALQAGIGAARDLALDGTNDNRAVLLLSDGSTGASGSACTACGTNCMCNGTCACGSHDHGNGHGPSVPIHTVAVGPSWSESNAQLTRTAVHQGGIPWSADTDALQLKQRMIHLLAQQFEAGVSLTTNFTLASGTQRSGAVPVPLLGDASVTFVLAWDRAVTPGNLSLEITSPAGNVLNLSNPAISSTPGATYHIVRVGIPPSGGNDGIWSIRAIRRLGSGPGEDQRLHLAALGNGWGRVEPAVTTPYAYTGEPLRVTFRIRESYWPTNGFDSVTATATVTAPSASIGETASGLTLSPDSTFQGDARPGLEAALDTVGGTLAGRTTEAIVLGDGGPGADGSAADRYAADHYYTGWFVPRHAGDHQFTARFQFRTGSGSFTRESHFSLRVGHRLSSSTSVNVVQKSTNNAGERVSVLAFTPRDAFGNRMGPGRSDAYWIGGATPDVSLGSVSDMGSGTYHVTATTLRDDPPVLVASQPGRFPILIGTSTVPAIVQGPEIHSFKSGELTALWRTALPAACRIEAGESIGEWTATQTTPLSTEHRVVLPGLRGNRRYFVRVTATHPSGTEVQSDLREFLTPPTSVSRITVDRLAYNDAVSNRITGRIHLDAPLETGRTVALSTAQTFNTDNPFTNATATVFIPANVLSVDWELWAGPVDRDVELHASALLGDFPPHVILKLIPPTTQVLVANDPAGPYTTNTAARIDPYHRVLDVPIDPGATRFLRLLSPTNTTLRIEGATSERLRIRY